MKSAIAEEEKCPWQVLQSTFLPTQAIADQRDVLMQGLPLLYIAQRRTSFNEYSVGPL